MCPVYDVPFRYFIPPLTCTPAHAGALLFLFFSLSRAKPLVHRHPSAQPPRNSRSVLEVSALESVHSSLRSFSFRGVSYDFLSNHATGSKYSFATNFHLHVSSPLGLPSSANAVSPSYTVPLPPTSFYSFTAGYCKSQRGCKRIKGFQVLEL